MRNKIMKLYEKYLMKESINQVKLRSKFKFLDPELQHKITMDVWHYIDPKIVNKGAKVFSKEKTFADELIKRVNLDSYKEYVSDKGLITKMRNVIKGLNLDKSWEYDKEQKAFIKK
jgi:hypothetical protein